MEITTQISERDPYAREQILPSQPLALNPAQATALEKIIAALEGAPATPEASSQKPEAAPEPASGIRNPESGIRNLPDSALPAPHSALPSSTFLLHGVTGCGKTEIYLQAIAHALEQGKGAIVLVPEISLTPQTVERFKARFSSGKLQTLVAVLHQHLSAGERHDEWHKIRQGRARIVIGARSAIFAPVDPLGLIIVDEEHEHTYKQEEAPRYHARDVASHARPDGRRDRRARLGHAVAGKLLQLQDAANTPCSNCRSAWTIKKCRASASWTCGRPCAQGKGIADFFAATQGGHHAAAGTRRADDSIFEPARLLDFVAMPEMRLRRRMPELQRLAHVSSAGAKAALPHLRLTIETVPAVCPNEKCKNPAHPLFRHWARKRSKRHSDETFSQRAHQAHGFRHDEAQGRLSPHPRRFSRRAKSTFSSARK